MSRRVLAIGAIGAVAFFFWALSVSESQTQRFTFQNDAEGWEAIPSSKAATLSAIADASAAAGHALEVRYRVERGKIVGLRHPVDGVKGTGVRVSVKTDTATVVVLGVIEKDGSAYNKPVITAAGEWQDVSAPFAEFQLADNSKDENGRIDPDQVRTLMILDAAGLVPQGGSGQRRLWVANYEISSQPEAAATKTAAGEWNFETTAEGWIAIPPPGGARVQLSVVNVRDNPAVGSGALRIAYRVEKKKVAGVLRQVNRFDGAGVRTFLMTRAPTVVVIGLIERDGSSYHHPVQMAPDEWREIDLRLQDFSLAEDSKDENGRLDPDQVNALVIADAAGFLPDADGDRELLVGKYEIVSAAAAATTSTSANSTGGGEHAGTGYVPLVTTGLASASGARATKGISYPGGKFGQGVLADAPGELVAVPTRGLGRDEGTIELWVSPQFDMTNVRDFTGIVTMHPEPFAAGFKSSLLVFYSKDQKIVFLTNADSERAVSTERLNWKAGEWHHLAVSWGPRGNRLYVDGRVAAENRRGAPPGAIAPDVVLGNQTWTLLSQRFADTVIDEFRMSSVQRSDRDIETSAGAKGPLTSDDRTVALEHFDGSPSPPLMLAAEGTPFHPHVPGKAATLTVVAPDKFPSGTSLKYTISTPTGAVVHSGEETAPAGRDRIGVTMTAPDSTGFYRVALRLERGGDVLNVGDDWFRIERPEATPRAGETSRFFGGAGSSAASHDDEEFFRLAAAAGVRSARLPFEWAEIEPRKNEFVWDRYDRIVGWAKRYGIELVPTLFWDNPQPAWAGKGKANASSDDIYPPENLNAWTDFVQHVVARYKNDIQWWIPINEPNLSRYWYPRPDATAYVALLRVTREAALRANPDAKILGLSVSGIDLKFLEDAFKAGALNYVDAVGLHPYRAPRGPDERVPLQMFNPNASRGTLREGFQAVRRLMDKYNGSQKKLWVDELGQPYREDFVLPNWSVPEATAAAYLTKVYVDAKAAAIERVLWFSFWGDYGSFALVKPDGTPTLPFAAYRAAADRLGTAMVTGEDTRAADIRSVRFSSPTESTEVLWSVQGTTDVALQAGERAFDLYGFPAAEANASRRLKLTTSPSYIVRPKS